MSGLFSTIVVWIKGHIVVSIISALCVILAGGATAYALNEDMPKDTATNYAGSAPTVTRQEREVRTPPVLPTYSDPSALPTNVGPSGTPIPNSTAGPSALPTDQSPSGSTSSAPTNSPTVKPPSSSLPPATVTPRPTQSTPAPSTTKPPVVVPPAPSTSIPAPVETVPPVVAPPVVTPPTTPSRPNGVMPGAAVSQVVDCRLVESYGPVAAYDLTIKNRWTGGVYDINRLREAHWNGEPFEATSTNYRVLIPTGTTSYTTSDTNWNTWNFDDPRTGNSLGTAPVKAAVVNVNACHN